MRMHRFLLIALAGIATLSTMSAALAGPSNQRYIVQFVAGKVNNGKAALNAAGGVIKQDLGRYDAVAAEIPYANLASFRSNPNVKLVEVDELRFPISTIRSRASGADSVTSSLSQPAQVVPYGVTMVQAEGYVGIPHSGIKVCVIDSGYDYSHEDKQKVDVTGTDDPKAGKWTEDGSGHGTHTSGTINALNNTIGVLGVFPGVPMHIVRVFGNDGLWAYSSELINAVDDCVRHGAKVISMSLGGDRPGVLENAVFRQAEMSGVLSVAAAGNGGDGRVCDIFTDPGHPERQSCKMHYPAGYDSVVSVAAVDSKKNVATFSQINSKVEIAAPGVGVLSTVPTGSMMDVTLTSTGVNTKEVVPMDNFPIPASPVTGPLKDCGLGASVADCGSATGNICLIERGVVTFATKALACEAAGGIAAVIFQREGAIGPVLGTLGVTQVNIPVVGITRDDGLALRNGALGHSATLSFVRSYYDYDYFDGTSMATPHVSGVAALIWSTHPLCRPQQIREAMNATAIDLGTPGRDKYYGNGLVQARAASRYLDMHPCSGN